MAGYLRNFDFLKDFHKYPMALQIHQASKINTALDSDRLLERTEQSILMSHPQPDQSTKETRGT